MCFSTVLLAQKVVQWMWQHDDLICILNEMTVPLKQWYTQWIIQNA